MTKPGFLDAGFTLYLNESGIEIWDPEIAVKIMHQFFKMGRLFKPLINLHILF